MKSNGSLSNPGSVFVLVALHIDCQLARSWMSGEIGIGL